MFSLRLFVTLALALALLNLTACSSMRTVDVDAAMRQSVSTGIDYGKLAEVKMLDGRSAEFRITDITPEGIGGGDRFYPYAQMKSLRIEDRSGSGNSEQTWAVVLGILALAGLVALIANADDVRICSPGPCPEPEP
jgi:hypothetical protein